MWDTTLRHEIGHRVDPQVNATDGYCKTADGGGWEYWDSPDGIAARMVEQSAGAIKSWGDAAQKQQIIDALQELIAARTFAKPPLDARLKALSFLSNLATDAAQQALWASIQTDNVYIVFPTLSSDSAPWNTTPAVTLNGKFIQEAYSWGKWVSYDVSARTRQVSNYQFRAPGEWFAEAYAAYYDPSGGSKGALLTGRDDPTKAWFDSSVDPQGGAGSVDPTTQVG